MLDGELVCFDREGRPDWNRLRRRSVCRDATAHRAAASAPACFVAFDVLELDGEALAGQTWTKRRLALEALGLRSDHWRTTPVGIGLDEGAAVWRFTIDQQLEGVVAKRLSSRYLPGERSRHWLKVKHSWARDALGVKRGA
jgi:bifunctional non-homologous end joining protein LigD